MTGVMPTTPLPGNEFVGREAELMLLVGGLEEAKKGRGSLLLIGGEPGIGKSRLVAEFASVARDRDVSVLWGRVWEGGGAPAYWPWIQALRAHLRATGAERFREQLGAGAADVAHLLPEVRTLVDQPLSGAVEADAARFQLFDSVTSLLRSAAGEGPLVLLIEDIHAADTPSILLLRFLASQLSDMGLLAVATYRDVELGPEHPLTPALAEMAREPVVRRVGLGGLATADIARMVEALTGHHSDERLIAGLWQRTNGNPLFLNEALRLLTPERRRLEELPGDRRLALPASVREAIIRRVQQLPATPRRVLSVAAVLGPEFDRAVLIRASEDGARSVVVALDEAAAAGLVVQIGPARHRFAHALVREALYERMGVLERSRLHARIALTLEQQRATASEEVLPELAHHYFEAAQGLGADDANDADASFAAKAMDFAARQPSRRVRRLPTRRQLGSMAWRCSCSSANARSIRWRAWTCCWRWARRTSEQATCRGLRQCCSRPLVWPGAAVQPVSWPRRRSVMAVASCGDARVTIRTWFRCCRTRWSCSAVRTIGCASGC